MTIRFRRLLRFFFTHLLNPAGLTAFLPLTTG
jgi:hypothetical protein